MLDVTLKSLGILNVSLVVRMALGCPRPWTWSKTQLQVIVWLFPKRGKDRAALLMNGLLDCL